MSRAPATRSDLAKTNVASVGSALSVAEVEPPLSQLDATLRRHGWSEDVAQMLDDGTVALLLTEEPRPGHNPPVGATAPLLNASLCAKELSSMVAIRHCWARGA